MLTSSFHSFVSYFETFADSSRRSITKRPSVGFCVENATVNDIEWSQRSRNTEKKPKNRLISSRRDNATDRMVLPDSRTSGHYYEYRSRTANSFDPVDQRRRQSIRSIDFARRLFRRRFLAVVAHGLYSHATGGQ